MSSLGHPGYWNRRCVVKGTSSSRVVSRCTGARQRWCLQAHRDKLTMQINISGLTRSKRYLSDMWLVLSRTTLKGLMTAASCLSVDPHIGRHDPSFCDQCHHYSDVGCLRSRSGTFMLHLYGRSEACQERLFDVRGMDPLF